MSEMDKAMFWAFGWAQAFLYPDKVGQRIRRRIAWAVHRFELACRENDRQRTGPRCSFCEMTGHDELKEACPSRVRAADEYVFCGSVRYPRLKGGEA